MASVYSLLFLIFTANYVSESRGLSIPNPFNPNSIFNRTLIPFPPGRTPFLNNILIRHYNGKTTDIRDTYAIRTAADKLLSDERFDWHKPTVVYAHGYLELETDISIQTVLEAYIDNGKFNILLVDWSNLAFGDYITSAANSKFGGDETGKMLEKLINGGVPLDSFHLVGHSLGAHFAATAARYLKDVGHTVKRLSALDAAFPLFYPQLLIPRLKPTDAQFVDVIHTDAGGYGTPESTGTLDFWPNGGKQYFCPATADLLTPEDFCGHHFSWRLWSQSVRGFEFPARQCYSYQQLTDGECHGDVTYMGLQASPEFSGDFYLRTGSEPPYTLGNDGIEPTTK